MFTLDIKSDLTKEFLWKKAYIWHISFAESQNLDTQSHGDHGIYCIVSKGPESFAQSGKWSVTIFELGRQELGKSQFRQRS